MADPAQLSRRERQIMEVIYARMGAGSGNGGAGASGEGEEVRGVSANEVMAGLADPPTRTSVRTTLRILEGKGHLTHVVGRGGGVAGREFLYRPVAARGKIGKRALQGVLRAFFGNSLPNALAAYFADGRAALSAEEARQLKEMIDQAKKRGD